ncbi:hypothetical protein [Paraburkholderia sp. BR13444]|uniref:hypothetical protein n=1 Tax=Paraburkholderia sp. BR13444 TaxID=3236997 RepID=UPI0034CE58C1
MTTNTFSFTAPTFSRVDGVLFSAYRVGDGYWSFALSYEAACEKLGARTQEREQVLLAFALNRHKIMKAVAAKALAGVSARVVLEAADFD